MYAIIILYSDRKRISMNENYRDHKDTLKFIVSANILICNVPRI